MSRFSFYLIFGSFIFFFFNCKKDENNVLNDETILKGKATIYVDETVTPIVEDEVMVFEGSYDAKFTLISESESEVLNSLFNKKASIVVLARNLSKKELNLFEQRKIVPKITKFAIDGIAFVSNKSSNDTLIALKDVIGFMKGERSSKIKGIVFDNPNSSTVSYMNNLAGLNNLPENDIYTFKTNNEVLKFVSENNGMIGVVGVNWLSQPVASMESVIKNINVLSVKGLDREGYYAPSQNNFAEGTYPLLRDLYIVNCQGYSGLGMGLSSFVAGDIGQRIILKSGLLPYTMPTRKLNIIRNKSDIKKK
ncbi:phosphate ABC transporter substrate-binding protein (PhoT family) [Flavobacterium sp. 1]|uniref:PstS family phosphate ABC transporter substrate-binding protein n=1 Tax=Flavobacterium sp. 1 TaxID=2035200 RepID=UPI000C242B2E|nr:substrate-binding domain-containing protein [Flavobacterium sp. 1]PJJ10738.1 phosphate ABC transporter substrate-binding protein (PhoT family) [Flavobacterium sp. 1]